MIHSICPYQSPDGTKYLVYWKDRTPMVLDLSNNSVTSPPVRGRSISSSSRWSYALSQTGYLIACNGTDKKFFDGDKWRELGLPALTKAQVSGIQITMGAAGLNQAQIDAINLTIAGAASVYLDGDVVMKFWNVDHGWNGSFGLTHDSLPGPAATYLTGNSLLFDCSSLPMKVGHYDVSGVVDSWDTPWAGMPAAHWDMAVTAAIVIPNEGEFSFHIEHDDGMFFGIGGGASMISGNFQDGSGAGWGHLETGTAANGYEVMGGTNMSGAKSEDFSIYFPGPGTYPIEFDFAQWIHAFNFSVTINGVEVKNVAPEAGPGDFEGDTVGRDLYCVLFDEDADITVNTDEAVGPPSNIGKVVIPAGQKVLITGLPDYSGSTDPKHFSARRNVSKVFALTGDGNVSAQFCLLREAVTLEYAFGGGGYGDLAIQATGVDAQVGDIVGFGGSGYDDLDGHLFQVRTRVDADNFTIPCPQTVFGGASGGVVGVLLRAKYNETTATIAKPFFLDAIMDTASDVGIPGSTVGTAEAGYQFYLSIYNKTVQHLGNRIAIGRRLKPEGASIVTLANLPDIASIMNDDELSLLIGRTGDGGEVPYAVMHADGSWHSTSPYDTSAKIVSSKIDGSAELPINNDEPPAFNLIWREGDRLCGVKYGVADGGGVS